MPLLFPEIRILIRIHSPAIDERWVCMGEHGYRSLPVQVSGIAKILSMHRCISKQPAYSPVEFSWKIHRESTEFVARQLEQRQFQFHLLDHSTTRPCSFFLSPFRLSNGRNPDETKGKEAFASWFSSCSFLPSLYVFSPFDVETIKYCRDVM